MGRMQRTKGKVFERKIAAELRTIWPDAVVRRASQAERADNPDVFIEGGPAILGRLWLELQDAAQPTPLMKLDQAEHDALSWGGMRAGQTRFPIVVWHKLGARTVNVTMRLWVLDHVRGASVALGSDDVVTMCLDSFLRITRDSTIPAQEAA